MFTIVRRLFGKQAEVRSCHQRQVALNRLLTLHAMTRTSGRCFRMVCDRLGPSYLHFQSARELTLGQALEFEVLLSPDTPVRLSGFVKSLDEGRGCAGELALNADAETRGLLEAYAARHMATVKGGEGSNRR